MELYNAVLKILTPYFGLGAQKFLDRQVRGHLGISPEQLAAKHLDDLAKWCHSSGALFLQDDLASDTIRRKILNLK